MRPKVRRLSADVHSAFQLGILVDCQRTGEPQGQSVFRLLIRICLLTILLLGVAGCSLMAPQPQLIIPTQPAVAAAENPTPGLLVPNEAGQLVTDPVSDVVPTVDPAIEALIAEAVSYTHLTLPTSDLV